MKRVLVTGSRGQVGTELLRLAPDFYVQAIGRTRRELDICDSSAVNDEVEELAPDVIINTAAYTAVDKAEQDKGGAFSVNEIGVGNLARACTDIGIPFIHISTDYVFDGRQQTPYSEDDPVRPLCIYGESKLAGEQAAINTCTKTIVLRTAWVYSAHGNNFVKSMLHCGAQREELRVVNDQHGGPTAARDIADTIWKIVKRLDIIEQPWGIYHYCGVPDTTWHAFAEAIFDEARRQDYEIKVRSVIAIPSKEYPALAPRPKNSILNCEKIQAVFDICQPNWRDSLIKVVEELKA
ncbi:MAG: dTDP-4-dehydrorhamnose reductase [Gammaproteobacteria bacterium]|nr:dTDP-4-dehydrorhamnose reductase [Gammaproteobacteria bacterium]